MPSKSPAQHRLMEAAAHTPGGYGGVPQSVGEEYVNADKHARADGEEIQLRTEMDYAKAMAAGLIESPYRYENSWLFNIRITGTGYAYREGLQEHAYRPPQNYLTPEFIERCNGLPVIYEHPEKLLLDSEEFSARIIGTVIYPYQSGDNIMGIARILDNEGAELMQTTHTSTSPGFNFAGKGSVQKVKLDKSDSISVEGSPSLLDHVAICPLGVWDKGGAPSGVVLGEQDMADDKEDKARADAEAPAWAKAIADSVSALTARMDSMEKARADAETEKEAVKAAEEAGKKEESEEEKAMKAAEKAKADAEKEERDTAYADMQRQLADLRRQLPRDLTDEERNQIASAQAKADSVCAALGKSVPHPMLGETAGAYRRRVASILQPHSERWKGKNLKVLPDDAFETVEGQIYADAQTAARAPVDIAPYELRARQRTTSAGHRVTEYVGSPRAWMEDFMPPIKHLANIRTFAHNKGN